MSGWFVDEVRKTAQVMFAFIYMLGVTQQVMNGMMHPSFGILYKSEYKTGISHSMLGVISYEVYHRGVIFLL